jgi:hypothetical protein
MWSNTEIAQRLASGRSEKGSWRSAWNFTSEENLAADSLQTAHRIKLWINL